MSEIADVLLCYPQAQVVRQSSLGPLIHTFHRPANSSVIETTFGQRELPASLLDFWERASGCRLYEDVTYGQWGLILYSPEEAQARSETVRKTYPETHRPSDLVIGEFLGDTDILFTEAEVDGANFGAIYVASPLDPRSVWPRVGDDLADFLDQFARANGEKFWET